ncbi:hypothetical protein CEV33_3478 [Brucella grignonensis]|uniref:Uncharacterized protein n=1 Tax=Brucella grignonensis TaxID=94627 RepID=A0A256EZ10_9HYPH|nr:hypothetical protein CEV33_3478 [Brucella grignonensis]
MPTGAFRLRREAAFCLTVADAGLMPSSGKGPAEVSPSVTMVGFSSACTGDIWVA